VKELTDDAEARATEHAEPGFNDCRRASGKSERVGEVPPGGFEEFGAASPELGESGGGAKIGRVFGSAAEQCAVGGRHECEFRRGS